MNISFYLRNEPGEGSHITAIYARICYNSYKFKYYPSESINSKHWDKATQRAKKVPSMPELKDLNNKLDSIVSVIKQTALRYANTNGGAYPSPETLKTLVDVYVKPHKAEKLQVTFIQYFEQYINDCKSGRIKHVKTKAPLKEGTIKNYTTVLNNIKLYKSKTGKPVNFDNINTDFLSSFGEYMAIEQKQALNTIGKYTKVIKTILGAASEAGINNNMAFKSKKFASASEDADTIYLPDSILKELATIKFETPRLERTRDLFLIGCYTGLRFSDFSTLRPEHISGDFITIIQTKTGNPVVIPLHETVKAIMAKYGGELPQAYSNQKTNDYIKDVCKEVDSLKGFKSVKKTKAGSLQDTPVEKYKLVSTHTARRSFCTNEYLAGTPTLTIMAISGHRTEKAFMKYIRVTPGEHAKILKDIWQERKETTAKRIAI